MTIASDCCPGRVQAPAKAIELPDSNWYLPCKAAADFILAVLLFILTLPLMILAMALVKLTSRGPFIYSQIRVGRDRRTFNIYKIRTMKHDCERLTGAIWSPRHDPRITPIGRFLRLTHLDELPQLWNILRGEMSLVGPRPERPEFVVELERAIPCYGDRLLVRPGVTGLAQVQLPPDTDLNSVRSKLACDLYYVQRFSPWLDLRILLGTVSAVFGIPFAVPRMLLRIPSRATVEAAYRDLSAGAVPVTQMQST